MNDYDLILEFADNRSETAFRTIVERHAGMVQGTAQRILCDSNKAEEVTQAVFILLARKAAGLPKGTCVAGWLYRAARLVALEAVRSETRRQKWHHAYADMNTPSDSESIWQQISPLLDEAMAQLRGADRDAVVLRFLEERSFADVAKAMGTTEAAAKMRVSRALEKLRTVFAQRGVSVPGTALVAALSANALTAAPVGLPAAVTSMAINCGVGADASVAGLLDGANKSLAWLKLKATALACFVVVSVVTTGALFLQWLYRDKPQPVAVRSFDSLVGTWTGTFRLRSEAQGDTSSAPAELAIRTRGQGRECEIEMRISTGAGRLPVVYRFKHQLNETGNKVTTEDDPQIGRSDGEGIVTDSLENAKTDEWKLAFRTAHENDEGFSECTWSYKRNELTIVRLDSATIAPGANALRSELKLRRTKAAATSL